MSGNSHLNQGCQCFSASSFKSYPLALLEDLLFDPLFFFGILDFFISVHEIPIRVSH